jgi:hypothetical protein
MKNGAKEKTESVGRMQKFITLKQKVHTELLGFERLNSAKYFLPVAREHHPFNNSFMRHSTIKQTSPGKVVNSPISLLT